LAGHAEQVKLTIQDFNEASDYRAAVALAGQIDCTLLKTNDHNSI